MIPFIARMEGDCLFCTRSRRAIKKGEKIVPHPAGKEFGWVHARHLEKKAVAPKVEQMKLF